MLAGFACLGLIVGWVIHYTSKARSGLDPTLRWPTTGLVTFLAAFLCIAAARASRARRHRQWDAAHRAVNLLVMSRTCSRVGAGVVGGYFGFAMGYLGRAWPIQVGQAVLMVVTVLAGIIMVIGALALERACEVRPDAEE